MSIQDILAAHHANTTGMAMHYLTLYSMVYGIEAKKVFEFGSGYSTLAILEGLQEQKGHLYSCDVRPRETACPYVKESNGWTFLHKKSSDAKNDITQNAPYDLVFHDGSHSLDQVHEDLTNIVKRIKLYGLLLVHDTQHSSLGEEMRMAVRSALQYIRHSSVTLPYGYGLTIIRIEEIFGNGEIQVSRKKTDSQGITIPY